VSGVLYSTRDPAGDAWYPGELKRIEFACTCADGVPIILGEARKDSPPTLVRNLTAGLNPGVLMEFLAGRLDAVFCGDNGATEVSTIASLVVEFRADRLGAALCGDIGANWMSPIANAVDNGPLSGVN